jgi:hypothetical protein
MDLSGCRVSWDFFTQPDGVKQGRIRELDTQNAVLCCSQRIDERRWIRVVLHPESAEHRQVSRVSFARVIDPFEMLDLWEDESMTLYRHQLEWITPLDPQWVELLTPSIWNLCQCSNLILKQSAQDLCGLCALRFVVSGI